MRKEGRARAAGGEEEEEQKTKGRAGGVLWLNQIFVVPVDLTASIVVDVVECVVCIYLPSLSLD